MSRRWRLILASVAFFGWLSYLGYAALSKNRGPVISVAQAAAAKHAYVVEVNAGPDGKPRSRVKFDESLNANDLAPGTEIEIVNLPDASGFVGEGRYLLLLNPEVVWRNPGEAVPPPAFTVVGQQRSPGNDLTGIGPPLIYPMTDGIRKQYEKLTRSKDSGR